MDIRQISGPHFGTGGLAIFLAIVEMASDL